MYGAWGADSVFTGSEPDEEVLDPTQAKVSVGYGRHYKRETDEQVSSIDVKAGMRAQRDFGRGLGDDGRN